MQRPLFSSSILILALTACTQSGVQTPQTSPAPETQRADTADAATSDLKPVATLTAETESTYGNAIDSLLISEDVLDDETVERDSDAMAEPLRLIGVPTPPQSRGKVGESKRKEISQMRSRGRGGAVFGGAAFGATGSVAAPAPVAAQTEQYTNYGVNDMTDATKDRFSTFSIDVDTASYTISRRKLNEGALPPTASVRVEEFVNYFPYSYDPPTTDAPFAVHMEAAPDPFNSGHHLFRVGIKAQDLDLSNRKPVHLTFLVDVSGSMNRPDKLGLAKRSLRLLIDQLRPGDTVALATYAGNVRAVLDPTDIRQKSQIHAAIEDLSAGGSTAMNSGIQLAYRMAQSSAKVGHENRVIVLSDGDANVGPASHQAILESIKGYAKQGITLSTIGLGMGNYKDTMMEQLANKGDGNYYYIDSFSEAKKVFGTNLAGTLQVIAKDVKIQVEFNPETVATYRLIGYENRDIADRDFRNDKVDAGEIGTGHTVTALYDIVLANGGVQNTKSDLATVRIRNKKPGPDSPAVEWMTQFDTQEIARRFGGSSPNFKIAVAAATFAEVLRGSPYASEITWQQLAGLASEAQRPGVAEDDELLSLIQKAAGLSDGRGPTAGR